MRDVSLSLLDLAQNSIAAGASRIVMRGRETPGRLDVLVEDDGCGMTEAETARVKDPFYTTRAGRNIGLGVPLFCQAAEQTGGWCAVDSLPGAGTRVSAMFCTGHIDMPPIGDLAETFIALAVCNPRLEICLCWEAGENAALLDTRLLRARLEEVPLHTPEVLRWIREYWEEQFTMTRRKESAARFREEKKTGERPFEGKEWSLGDENINRASSDPG